MDSIELRLHETPPGKDETTRHLTRSWGELRTWGKGVVGNMRRRWAPRCVEQSSAVLWAEPWQYLRYGTGVTKIALPDPTKCPGASILLEPIGGAIARAFSTAKGLMDGYDELPAYGEFVSHLGKWVRIYVHPHWPDPKLHASGVEVVAGPLNGDTHVTTDAGSFTMQSDLYELINFDALTKVTCISVDFTVYALESIYTPCWGMMRATGLYDWSPTGHTLGLVDTTPTDQRLVIGKADFKADGPYMYAYSPLDNRYVRAYVSQNIHVNGAPPVYPVLTWVLKTEATLVEIP